MPVIDIHAHMLPENFPPLPPGVPAAEWPAMEKLPDGRATMVIGGQNFRVFEPAYWDAAARIAHLDAEAIDLQLLSPLPEMLGYWLQTNTAAALAAHINDTIATAVAEGQGRLAGFGMLPLQDVALSVNMLPRLADMGLKGVLVASNINGVSIADARFDPVLRALEMRNMALFVHGYRPAGADRWLGSALLTPIIGAPQDTMAAIASFIMTDVLDRFPELRLGFAHGGGSFGSVLDRMDHVWHEFPEMRTRLKTAPRDYVKRFFFDTVTFSGRYLQYLLDAFGANTLMAGTDGPTPIGQRDLRAFVESACKHQPASAEGLLWRNAARFLGIDETTWPPAHDPAATEKLTR